jgi:hypothetical protein
MPKVCSCVVACGRGGAGKSARRRRTERMGSAGGGQPAPERAQQRGCSCSATLCPNGCDWHCALQDRRCAAWPGRCCRFSALQLRFCASSLRGRQELLSAHRASFRCSLFLTTPSSRIYPVVLTLHASQDGPVQPTQTDQLKFYGLFKQASIGDVNTSRPGMMGACVPPFRRQVACADVGILVQTSRARPSGTPGRPTRARARTTPRSSTSSTCSR